MYLDSVCAIGYYLDFTSISVWTLSSIAFVLSTNIACADVTFSSEIFKTDVCYIILKCADL